MMDFNTDEHRHMKRNRYDRVRWSWRSSTQKSDQRPHRHPDRRGEQRAERKPRQHIPVRLFPPHADHSFAHTLL